MTSQAPVSDGSPGEPASVLIVDDHPGNLLALAAVLQPLSVRVVTAGSGEEALRRLENEAFAVALLDVQMPGMDGFELAHRMRALPSGRELPVLFFTAVHHDEAYVKRGYALGAADYITKPFDPDIVRARVKGFVALFRQRESVRQGQLESRTRERDEVMRRLVAFERIATAALETNDLKALLDELLHAFIDAAEAAELAAIFLCERGTLQVEAAVGLTIEQQGELRLRVGEGFAGTIALERRPLQLSDAQQSNLVKGGWVKASGVQGLYGVPLLHAGELVGVAYIGSTWASEFSAPEKQLFAAAAERAALAVARHLEVSRMTQVLSAAPAYIAIVRAPECVFSFVNAACTDLFDADLSGTKLSDSGFGPKAFELVEDVRRTGRSRELSELRVRSASGQAHYLRFTAQPLEGPSGDVDSVLLFAVDQTAQVRARQEIEATQAARVDLLERERAARQAAELASAAKDEFLATVSHELRTPLNAILGWSRLAISKPGVDPARALTVIERNARAQARIVEDVLDFSRIAQGKMRLALGAVDLASVVGEALEAVRPAAESKSLIIDVDIALGGSLRADPDRLRQVVWNLLSNAVKFTPPGGAVMLSARRDRDRAVLSIKDTGMGFDPDFQPHLFEPFRQANGSNTRRHGGLGLGLSIVRRIAQAHGGNVLAHSHGAGQGATFTLELPLSEGPASAVQHELRSAPEQRELSTRRLDGLKVLLVDDEDDTREFMAEALQGHGARVTSCGSVSESMSCFSEVRPDVLVSDIAMPEADGYDLLRWVRQLPSEQGGHTPAIAVTAHARKEAREQALDAGYQRHAAKPVDIEALIADIAELAVPNAVESASFHSKAR